MIEKAKASLRRAFEHILVRYAFAVVMVAAAFGLKKLLEPLTGTGAPFVLFFAAVAVSALLAGRGPGICATVLSLPIGAYIFVVRAGYPTSQAAFQAALFAVDGLVVVHLSFLMTRARRAAETAEGRRRDLIELAPVAFFLADIDGRFTDVNQAACRMLGYTREELLGMTVLDVVPPEEAQRLAAVRTALLAPGHEHNAEWTHKRKDGTAIPVEVSSKILSDGRWQAFVRDISGRRRIEDSERRLHLALESAQMGTWDLDLLSDTSVRSFRHDQIFGYASPIPTWGAAIFMNHVVPEDRDAARRAFATASASDEFELECRIRWPDESIHWISAKGRAYRNPKGEPVRLMGTVVDVSERKRGEEALRRSEQEFRSLAESMPQIVWATRPDGWNIYFNQQWVTYTGLTLEESYGEGWITPFHPDDRQRAWDAWQRATRYRDTYALECRLRRADGVYRWWLVRGMPLIGDNDEIMKWFGTCTDIEQIKAAEQRLKESEAKFSGIISIAADAIISVDEQQRITIFNRGAEQIFGYTEAEAVGAPVETLIPARLRAAHHLHVETFASGDVTARRMGDRAMTIAGVRKNGEEFPAEAAISKLQIGDKTLLTVALRDITERTRIEKEQRFLAEAGAVLSSSLDYEQTLSTLGELVVRDFADWCIVAVIDHDERPIRLKVVSADPRLAPLAAQVERISPDRRRPHLGLTALETRRPFLIEQMTPVQLESLAQSADHLQLLRAVDPRSLMAVPLLIRGQLLGVLVFISSTPSRLYRPRDLRLAEALADRAALAIENGRLYQAAVHATRLRDEVAGVVAHDLRNPLAAIQMQATALKRKGSEPERRNPRPRDTILRAANRMNRLIGDLLDLTMIEAGQLGIERSRISARQLVADSVETQRPLAAAASIELRLEAPGEVPDVWGDHTRLLQVVENLVGNAIKFTPGGGRITVGAAPREDEVLFWVADTGSGISPDQLPHVFDRFWQAKKGARQGAGLGLPITRGIVETHGGRIWVESTLGRGSIFFFTIPQATRVDAPHPESTQTHG